VAAALALLILAMDPKVKRIHLVYVNKILMKKDQEDFEDLWSLIPNGERISYHSDIAFAPG